MTGLDMEARQEEQPDAAIPLDRQRLLAMLKTHKDTLAEMVDLIDADELDVELESPLQCFRPFGIARIDCDFAAALDGERRARQVFAAGGDLAQQLALERQLRLIDGTDSHLRGGTAYPVDRFLRNDHTRQCVGLADDVTEQLA